MRTPHDHWFHFSFRQVHHATAWLRAHLPPALVARIDWSTLRLCSERLHGLFLRLGVGDLIFEARLRERRLRVFLLLEHRSHADSGLHDTLVRYSVHLAHSQRRTRNSPPIPVITVVLYHGTGELELHPRHAMALADRDPEGCQLLSALQPQLHCITHDLGKTTEPEIRARHLTPLGTLTLLSLRFLRGLSPGDAIAALDRWGEVLRAVDQDQGPPVGEEAIATFGWYLLHVTEAPIHDVHMALERNLQRKETTIMSTAEKLRNEGRDQGLSQGLTQGRAETLLRQLRRRFGELPPSTEPRVRNARPSELDQWTDRVLDARTLAEVFGES